MSTATNTPTAVAIPTPARSELAYRHELTVEELAGQVHKIHNVMKDVMRSGVHYGVIPGTDKPTLLQPGAQMLCMLFRFDPQFAMEDVREGEHLDVTSTCTLYHSPTGIRLGSGMGSCSTRESRYAYRKASRTCPACGQEGTIIKGREEYGGGWLCFAKRGGCGQKWKAGDLAIEGQPLEGRRANPDLPDIHNTIRKMSNKRALVAAVLNVTAASDIFTQDMEDLAHEEVVAERPPVRARHDTPTPSPQGEVDEVAPEPSEPDQNAEDREELLRGIDAAAEALGYTQAKKTVTWAKWVGPTVSPADAPLEKVLALAAHLDGLLRERAV